MNPEHEQQAREARARRDAARQAKQEDEALSLSQPEKAGQKEEHRPLLFDGAAFTADHFMAKRPPDPEMLLNGCPVGCVMALVAPPGAGKSTLCSQLLAMICAGGVLFGKWEITKPRRCLFLSVEDTVNVIQQRVFDALHGLPGEIQSNAARSFSVPEVYGHVSLFELKGGKLRPNRNFDDLRSSVRAFKPGVLCLDTLARFCGGVEGDNAAMSEACSYLEELCVESAMNAIVVHHTSKAAGGLLARKEDELYTLLDAYAARGASALTGSVRWQMNLAPLSKELAVQKIGQEANGARDGLYVAARVCKVNYGMPESRIYLRHNCLTGLFERVAAVKEDARLQDDAERLDMLLSEMRRRERAGEKPLSRSRAGQDAFGWGADLTRKIVDLGIKSGRIAVAKNPNGAGQVLKLISENSENFEQASLF